MSHKCPAPSCNQQVSSDRFACRGHWYALPADLRTRIWSGYRTSSTDHWQAMAEAIDYLAERYA